MDRFNAHDYEVMISTLYIVKAALPNVTKASLEMHVYNEAFEKSLDNAISALKEELAERRTEEEEL